MIKLKRILLLGVIMPILALGQENFLLDECYNFHHNSAGYTTNNLMAASVIASDFILKGGGGASDLSPFLEIDKYEINAESSLPLTIWKRYYNGIEKCNEVLTYLEDTENNARFLAEAKFLRAYLYFELVKLFGRVPLILEGCDTLVSSLTRPSLAEVYTQIEKDLEETTSSLPLKSELSDSEQYKATKGAAESLLAMVKIYQKDWPGAQPLLESVINSGEYELLADFNALWSESNEHNVESIYEHEYYSDRYQDWGDWTGGFESNLNIQLWGPREFYGELGEYTGGWGFVIPTQELVDLFDAHGDSVRKHSTIVDLEDLAAQNGVVLSQGYDYTGYEMIKYTTKTAHLSNSFNEQLNWGQNFVKIRYAEILLLYAEVMARQGDNAMAMNYLNMVRERAGLDAIGNSLTSDEVLEAIFDERMLEFAGEGKRYEDLIRWRKAQTMLSQYGYEAEKDSLWPIPYEILNKNPLMVQNTTYSSPKGDIVRLKELNNPYAPKPDLPWLKVSEDERSIRPISMTSYQFSYCMNDSIAHIQSNFEYDTSGLMLSQKQFSYNTKTEVWSEFHSRTYTYDDSQKLTSTMEKAYINDKWDTLNLRFYKYPEPNILIDSMIIDPGLSSRVEIATWSSTTNTYVKNNFYWLYNETNEWVKHAISDSRHQLTYDDENRIIEDITQYPTLSNTWYNGSSIVYTYAGDLLIKSEYFSINNDEYYSRSEKLYTYDDKGNLTSERTYDTSNATKLESGKDYLNKGLELTTVPLSPHGLFDDLHHQRQKIVTTFERTVPPSTEADILSFTLNEEVNPATINVEEHFITIIVEEGTNISKLTPVITVSPGATYSPEGTQDFTEPVTYKVTAEDAKTVQDWIVSASIVLSSSTEELTKYRVYPNPSNDWIRINGISSPDTQIQIYNISGILVYNQPYTSNRLFVGGLSKGMYHIKIIEASETTTTNLIIKN